MKRKNGISLIIALLMIASTFVVGAETTSNCDIQVGGNGALEVTKKVWDGENWVDTMPAEIGDTVEFNITITYHEDCGYMATNIVVVDTIDPGDHLTYVYESANYEPAMTPLPIIQWNLTEDYGVNLSDGESVSILFELKLVAGYGTLTNFVEVYALEHCCQQELYGEADAHVRVAPPPELDFEKEVWNGTGWSDLLDGVTLGQEVKFRLTLTYNGYDDVDIMKCAIIEDWLPECCLEYRDNEEFIYPNEHFEDPEITNTSTYVKYDWTDKLFNLHNGESLVIVFYAEVVNYCDDFVENCASVDLWSCSMPCEECEHLHDEDCATINCTSRPPWFIKLVFVEDEGWKDEIDTVVGEILHFRLGLKYWGNDYLTDIRFMDVLPCILEYVEGSAQVIPGNESAMYPMEPEISSDGKTLWWNLTDYILTDNSCVGIGFYALVVGSTGGCCKCQYDVVNYACVTARVDCEEEPSFFREAEVAIRAEGNCPPDVPDVTGPATGLVDEELQFAATVYDSDDDQVRYIWSIGDETTEWSELVDSGTEVTIDRSFSEPGTYYVKAKVRDEHGVESDWTTYPVEVVVTEEEEEPGPFDFCIKKYSIGYVMVTIKNNCEKNLTNIDWNLTVTGGILNRINQQHNCTIEELAPGEHANVYSSKMFGKGSLLGIGKVTVKITAEVDGEEYIAPFFGIVLGKLFIDQTIKLL